MVSPIIFRSHFDDDIRGGGIDGYARIADARQSRIAGHPLARTRHEFLPDIIQRLGPAERKRRITGQTKWPMPDPIIQGLGQSLIGYLRLILWS